MSTAFDIKDAKADYFRHEAAHRGCTTGCPDRARLLLNWFDVAGRWGFPEADETHDERQARQYAERMPGAPR